MSERRRELVMTSIEAGPHYEIPSRELATWLEQQGVDRWWNVDGDPLLTGNISFPSPADEVAAELRRIDRPLLVQAKKDDKAAKGQLAGKTKLDELVGTFADNFHIPSSGTIPAWANDRLFYLCWKGSAYEWLLAEDSETTEQMRDDEAKKAQ
jgi:hypothetical protein